MKRITTGLAVLAVLVVIGLSVALNAAFWSGYGATPAWQYLIGGSFAALDIFKAVLPVLIAWAYAARHRLRALGGCFVFAVLVVVSLAAAVGFLSTSFNETTGGREAAAAKLASLEKVLSELDAKRMEGTRYPSSAVLAGDLAAMRQDRRWKATRQCEDATLRKSRQFCMGYHKKAAELAASKEATRIDEQRGSLRGEIAKLRETGAAIEADPQAAMVASLIPSLDKSGARIALVWLLACALELVAALGLFVATRRDEVPVFHRVPGTPHLQLRRSEPLRFDLEAERIFAEGDTWQS